MPPKHWNFAEFARRELWILRKEKAPFPLRELGLGGD
jgi:hypothetical protein